MQLPQTLTPDYTVAPRALRLRWWLMARFWCWCQGFARCDAESPELANPWWRR